MIRSKMLQALLVCILIDVVHLSDTATSMTNGELREARHGSSRSSETMAKSHASPLFPCLHYVLSSAFSRETAFHWLSTCFLPFSHSFFFFWDSFCFVLFVALRKIHMKGRDGYTARAKLPF